MRVTKYLAAAAALSLTSVPALADTANQSAGVSLSHTARAHSTTKHHNELLGSGVIIAIVAVIAIGVGIGVAVSDSSSSN